MSTMTIVFLLMAATYWINREEEKHFEIMSRLDGNDDVYLDETDIPWTWRER